MKPSERNQPDLFRISEPLSRLDAAIHNMTCAASRLSDAEAALREAIGQAWASKRWRDEVHQFHGTEPGFLPVYVCRKLHPDASYLESRAIELREAVVKATLEYNRLAALAQATFDKFTAKEVQP